MKVSWGRLVQRPRTPCLPSATLNACNLQHLTTASPRRATVVVHRLQWTSFPRRDNVTTSAYTTAPIRPGISHDALQNVPLDSPSPVHPEWEKILEDAFIYGIRNKDQLLFEADVGHGSEIGSRLIDKPPARQNIDLWRILLRAQALQNGHEGIKAIWRGLQYRGKAIRFDDRDPQVNAIWRVFLSAGASDHQFLWSLCKVAKRAKFDRPILFAEVVGAALEGSAPQRAVDFAAFLLQSHYRGREDLLAVFDSACRTNSVDVLKDFCKVYELVPKIQIYTDITSTLWERDRPSDAFLMHSFLISKGDLPPRFEVLEPFLSYLVIHHRKLSSFLLPLNAAGASFEAQARRFWSRERSRITGLSAESLNIVASKTLGVNPKKLSDQFVARAFATRAFSFDFTVNSLRMLGLIEVGPQAVRQAALTAPDLATLQARFSKFDDLGVDTGSSAFVRILRKVCDAGRWEMVQALVNNDLHHEVFESLELQERLLIEYYRTKDWLQLNRTLVVLNDGEFNDKAQARASNLILRTMVEVGDWAAALNLVRNMQERGLGVSPTLARSITRIFRDTKGSVFARNENVDRIAFLIGFLQDIVGTGTYLDIKIWRRPFRALGRLGRMNELECLIYWVADQYYKSQGSHRQDDVSPQLDVLFDAKLQKSLVSWCFRPHRGMTALKPEHCLRWTRILKRLRDVYGVKVEEPTIRWIFIRRLRWLFATGIRLRAHNMWARLRNTAPAVRYWELYDKMWDMKPAGQVSHDRNKVILHMRRRFPQSIQRQGSMMKSGESIGTGPENIAIERPSKADSKKEEEDIVVYTDLFHASWEDYKK